MHVGDVGERRHEPRPDRPDGLVGDHRRVRHRAVRHGAAHLPGHDLERPARLALRPGLADAHDRDEPPPARRRGLVVDADIRLAMVLATLGMPDDHRPGAEFGQHLGRNVARMGAGRARMAILPADRDRARRGRKGAKQRHRGADQEIHPRPQVRPVAGCDLVQHRDRGRQAVHLPVAGRPAASALPRSMLPSGAAGLPEGEGSRNVAGAGVFAPARLGYGLLRRSRFEGHAAGDQSAGEELGRPGGGRGPVRLPDRVLRDLGDRRHLPRQRADSGGDGRRHGGSGRGLPQRLSERVPVPRASPAPEHHARTGACLRAGAARPVASRERGGARRRNPPARPQRARLARGPVGPGRSELPRRDGRLRPVPVQRPPAPERPQRGAVRGRAALGAGAPAARPRPSAAPFPSRCPCARRFTAIRPSGAPPNTWR